MRCSFSKGSSVYFSPSLSFPAAKQRRLRVIKIIQVTMKESVRVPCLLSREFPCMLAAATVRYFPCERVWKNSSEKHLKVDSQQKPTDRNNQSEEPLYHHKCIFNAERMWWECKSRRVLLHWCCRPHLTSVLQCQSNRAANQKPASFAWSLLLQRNGRS